MKTVDLLIIGGGAAGLSAAVNAYDSGVKNILIIERNPYLGGILYQCIHNGFGLHHFKEELTGPEYADRFIKEVKKRNISYVLNSQVLELSKTKEVTYSSIEEGVVTIKAKAIILATGSYERTAGAIALPGDRPSGVITAGTAQKLLNIKGYLVGKKVIILGSGDIGLIMARRLTLEGAKVICVAELMPFSNGLNRNIQQCLIDYNIPLYLSTSVSKVIGKNRVEKIELSKVDDKLNFIKGSEVTYDCDALVLSIGLLPYTSLLDNLPIHYGKNRGALVDNELQTEIPGLFTCGNCLHVHDLVDYVSEEGETAGKAAAKYIFNNKNNSENHISVTYQGAISYVVPNYINKSVDSDFSFKFRVKKIIRKGKLIIKGDNLVIKERVVQNLLPSIMENFSIPYEEIKKYQNIELEIIDE